MDDERDGAGWTHSFRTERVGDQQLATALQHAGLSLRDFRTDDGTWVRAGLDPSRPPPDSPG